MCVKKAITCSNNVLNVVYLAILKLKLVNILTRKKEKNNLPLMRFFSYSCSKLFIFKMKIFYLSPFLNKIFVDLLAFCSVEILILLLTHFRNVLCRKIPINKNMPTRIDTINLNFYNAKPIHKYKENIAHLKQLFVFNCSQLNEI